MYLFVKIKFIHSKNNHSKMIINMSFQSQPFKFKQCVKFWLPKKQLEAM